jgi:Asp-tRNA(Asn)/Glu-tRNA(Gln) amidotransferase A subunit family amidase
MTDVSERGVWEREVWERDAWELANGVRTGELAAVDLLETFLARVERYDPDLNAFC